MRPSLEPINRFKLWLVASMTYYVCQYVFPIYLSHFSSEWTEIFPLDIPPQTLPQRPAPAYVMRACYEIIWVAWNLVLWFLKDPNVSVSPLNWDEVSLKWPYQVPCTPLYLSPLMQDEPQVYNISVKSIALRWTQSFPMEWTPDYALLSQAHHYGMDSALTTTTTTTTTTTRGSVCARGPLGHEFESCIGRVFSMEVGILNHAIGL